MRTAPRSPSGRPLAAVRGTVPLRTCSPLPVPLRSLCCGSACAPGRAQPLSSPCPAPALPQIRPHAGRTTLGPVGRVSSLSVRTAGHRRPTAPAAPGSRPRAGRTPLGRSGVWPIPGAASAPRRQGLPREGSRLLPAMPLPEQPGHGGAAGGSLLALVGARPSAPRVSARLGKPGQEQLRGAPTAHPRHCPRRLLGNAGWVTQDGGGNAQLPE